MSMAPVDKGLIEISIAIHSRSRRYCMPQGLSRNTAAGGALVLVTLDVGI